MTTSIEFTVTWAYYTNSEKQISAGSAVLERQVTLLQRSVTNSCQSSIEAAQISYKHMKNRGCFHLEDFRSVAASIISLSFREVARLYWEPHFCFRAAASK